MTEEYEPTEEETNELIDYLLESGALEIHGFDAASQSMTYKMTPKMRQILPDFYKEHFKFVNQIAFDLWLKGYVEIKFEEKGPLVMLIPGLDYKEIINTVNEEERYFLENMITLNGDII